MKYDTPEDKPQVVRETMTPQFNSVSTVDALWSLIMDQSVEVQKTLSQRLAQLFGTDTASQPYTMEELHDRLSTSEEQFRKGEYVTHDDVQQEVKALFESWR